MDAAQLYRMLVFATVVEQGSLTAAANELNVSRSMISQHLKKLETRLSCQLLQRTTRKMTLTIDGQEFYHYCSELLQLAKQAEAITQPSDAQLRGSIRICAPVALGEHMITPAIKGFHQQFPHIRLSLILDDHRPNILEQRIDISLQTDKSKRDDFKAIALSRYDEFLVASPEYIDLHGSPLHPDNLMHHQWLLRSSNHMPQNCIVKNSFGDEFKLRITPFVSCTSYSGLIDLASQGLGVAIVPNYLIQAHLGKGSLCRLLPDYHLREGEVYAVHPYKDSLPPRVRVFLEYLTGLSANKNVPEGINCD